jgi:hypothetical protein
VSGLVISNSHFLRVSFGDEAGDRLLGSRQEPLEDFYSLMAHVMQQGESWTDCWTNTLTISIYQQQWLWQLHALLLNVVRCVLAAAAAAAP